MIRAKSGSLPLLAALLSSMQPSSDSNYSLSLALQEQLGLKLESKKGKVEMLNIDHAESQVAISHAEDMLSLIGGPLAERLNSIAPQGLERVDPQSPPDRS